MILIDTANLYYGVKKRHRGTLMYNEFLRWVESIHGNLEKLVYIAQFPGADGFINYFKGLDNTEIVLKQPRTVYVNSIPIETTNFNVEMTIDALENTNKKLILCSACIDLLPLLQSLRSTDIYIYASGVPKIFENYAHVKEISGDFVKMVQRDRMQNIA